MNQQTDEKNLAMLCHLTALLGTLFGGGLLGVLGPMIIYLTQREKSAFISHHAKQSLNHQITFVIFYAICGLLFFVGNFFCIGPIFLIPLVIAGLISVVFEILAALAATRGEWSHIPWSIPFVS